MGKEISIEEEYTIAMQDITGTFKYIEDVYNHSSKRFSEMNNTLNWATTIVIALFVLFSKYVSDLLVSNCINDIFLIINLVSFLLLVLIFVLYKMKFIKYEDEMTKLLDSLTYEVVIGKRVFNLPHLNELYEPFNQDAYVKDLKNVLIITKQLKLYFKSAIYIFGFTMALIPVYFILKATV